MGRCVRVLRAMNIAHSQHQSHAAELRETKLGPSDLPTDTALPLVYAVASSLDEASGKFLVVKPPLAAAGRRAGAARGASLARGRPASGRGLC